MNIDLRVGYRPFNKQASFHRSEARFRGAFSGNRGGKTVAGAWQFLRSVFLDQLHNAPTALIGTGHGGLHKRLYWIVAPDYKLGQVSYDMVKRLLRPDAIIGENKSEHSFFLPGGSKVQLRSAEDPKRLVADSLHGIWIDEAPRVKAEAWRGALRARLADQQGWLLATGSPLGGRDNWVYQDLVSQTGQGGIETFTWTTEQNPYIPRSEIEWARERLPKSHYLRDWCASWDATGGAIYEDFDPAVHVISESQFRLEHARDIARVGFRGLFRDVVVGVDWGWTAAGCMLVIGQLDTKEDRFVVLDESYAAGRRILQGTGDTWLSEARRLAAKWGATRFPCDPEDPEAIASLSDNGISAVPAVNTRSHGIRRVSEAMCVVNGKPGLQVFSSCTNLLREIPAYQWKPSKEQTGFLDEPDDKCSDHALDPLRYGVVELAPVSIVDKFRQRTGRGSPVPIG